MLRRCVLCLNIFLLAASIGTASAAQWSRRYINALPDDAFASVETTAEGKKVRHLPHHDADGHLDIPHLLSALARINQVKWFDPANEAPARRHLAEHLEAYRKERMAALGPKLPVDLNAADEKTLMSLPFIGRARAHAILRHRELKGGFAKVEDLQQVMGIGPIIFDALKDLVTVR